MKQNTQLRIKMKSTTKPKTTKARMNPARFQAADSPVQATVAQASAALTNRSNGPISTASIAFRAYTLWEQAGRPHGRDLEHWLLAESQLMQNTRAFSA